MEGSTGTISNKTAGNGFVKAWAKINSNGPVNSRWYYSMSASSTQWISTGAYEADFTFVRDSTGRRNSPPLVDTR